MHTKVLEIVGHIDFLKVRSCYQHLHCSIYYVDLFFVCLFVCLFDKRFSLDYNIDLTFQRKPLKRFRIFTMNKKTRKRI